MNNNLSLVNKRWKKLFYRLVYQLIYLLGRKYLELAISFLVSQSAYKNEGSYCKLQFLINYIYYTEDIEAVIRIKDIIRIVNFANTPYRVYSNIRSYTSGTIYIRNGVFASESKMHKLNMQSLIE